MKICCFKVGARLSRGKCNSKKRARNCKNCIPIAFSPRTEKKEENLCCCRSKNLGCKVNKVLFTGGAHDLESLHISFHAAGYFFSGKDDLHPLLPTFKDGLKYIKARAIKSL
jgi:hypothetical protein